MSIRRVKDVCRWLDRFAPPALAESWDNVGLILGDPSSPLDRVMTCLTVTPATASEAISEGAGLIVSHHPVLFKATKTLRADRPETGYLWNLARAGISVASPHTAFDNTRGGINEILAGKVGLKDVEALQPSSSPSKLTKVVVFTPESDREAVLIAAFAAGAGRIGDYEGCSFDLLGKGSFLPLEGSNPTIGRVGSREVVEEHRLEFVCPEGRLRSVLAAVRRAHSYEEPAVDLYTLAPDPTAGPGVGRIGSLESLEPLGAFATRVAGLLSAPGTQYVGDPSRPIRRIAIGCGAGDDFLAVAQRAGADLLLTGEARFHRGLEAESLGMGLITVGHHASERPGVEALATLLAAEFPDLSIWASRSERDPFQSLT